MVQKNPLLNTPKRWRDDFPVFKKSDNKYTHGHAVIFGGEKEKAGAAMLACLGALRIGAGLTTLAAHEKSLAAYAKAPLSAMRFYYKSAKNLTALFKDTRKNAYLLGPGAGVTPNTKSLALALLKHDKPLVLDADALTVFEKNPQILFKAIHARKASTILTPHEGEFKRLFVWKKDRIAATKQAAKISGAIIVLKGSETIIAAPDGTTYINRHASPFLAKAGTGDVLAGMITGLLAQDMPPLKAASAAVWLHGDASRKIGLGLIAEDIPNILPHILQTALKSLYK